jgi:hypothetical protein
MIQDVQLQGGMNNFVCYRFVLLCNSGQVYDLMTIDRELCQNQIYIYSWQSGTEGEELSDVTATKGGNLPGTEGEELLPLSQGARLYTKARR